ncbi:MAG: peptidoglycan-binding protein [Oscillospiraceae bacterium]|nr:peptidoglycan-binding protein [Oscillospiraceae bacterium]
MTRQETIDTAVSWALAVAGDAGHGYDQGSRWGPNYDCSSFVISAWEAAGVPVRQAGASYTGNLYAAFLRCGFADVTARVDLATGAGLEKGDVLLNHRNHTELYIGGGRVVKASINENGGVTGGKTGDQTGREIYVGAYYNYPWDCVLRYEGGEADGDGDSGPSGTPAPTSPTGGGCCTVTLPVLRRGDRGEAVTAAQVLLIRRGCSVGWYGSDGDFGDATLAAVKQFQQARGLDADGVIGPRTWEALLGVSV